MAAGGYSNAAGTFAPNSSKNPNMALYLSFLDIAGNGNNVANGTVNLTNYTGPLSIANLQIGNGGNVGHFIFGNAVEHDLLIPTVSLISGNLTSNDGSTLDIGSSLSIDSSGQLICDIDDSAGGLSLDTALASALSLGGGTGRIMLDFDGLGEGDGPFWGMRWEGNEVGVLEADLDQDGFTGNGSIVVEVNTSYFNPNSLTVGLMNDDGVEYTYIGFVSAVPEPTSAMALGAGAFVLLSRRPIKRGHSTE
jgi:hypothetical protein